MDGEDELLKLLNSKGLARLDNKKLFEKIKRLLNIHSVQDLAECSMEQIVNIPNGGPDGLKDWQKTRLLEVLSESRARCTHDMLKTHNIYTVQFR